MAKGHSWRGDPQGHVDAAEGGKGPRTLKGIHISRGPDGSNFNVEHHYESAGKQGLGNDYREKPRNLASGKDVLAHVEKHMESLGRSQAKDERMEEDQYDNMGGNENER